MERLIYCIVFYEVGNTFNGKINGEFFFYIINYPEDYFEKFIRLHLKILEDLFKMFNGKVEFHSFQLLSIVNIDIKTLNCQKMKINFKGF